VADGRGLDGRCWYGRDLTTGLLLVVLAAGGLFGVLLDAVVDGEGVARLDQPAATFLAEHRSAWLTAVMRIVTTVGSGLGVTPIVLAVAGVVTWRTRRWVPMVLAAVVLSGAGLLETSVKVLVGRARPPHDLTVPGVTASSFAFPSGHATLAAAGFGVLAVLTGGMFAGPARRVALWAIVGLAAGAVGFSRMYLGLHWLTDVLAGWVAALGWLALVLTVTGVWERRRRGGSAQRLASRAASDREPRLLAIAAEVDKQVPELDPYRQSGGGRG
jgi:membrane-associated phospholipid phosphatase